MNSDPLLSAYQRVNASHRPQMVWHLGVDAGFFAEYSAMLNAMIYCLKKQWRFSLYADDANFGYANGWADYFEPFCEEVHEAFHHRYNLYPAPTWRSWLAQKERRRAISLGWMVKLRLRHFVGNVLALKTYGRRVRLSHSLRLKPDQVTIPALDINLPYIEAFGRMADITWRFNAETRRAVDELIGSLGLSPHFISCQLRGGDKVTETALLPVSRYVEPLTRLARGRDVYVLTDDYRLFEELRRLAPSLSLKTLCRPTEQGYVNSAFAATAAEAKRVQMQRFLAGIELLRRSDCYLGSVTTGPSCFMFKSALAKGVAIDCEQADIVDIINQPVAERARRAALYLAAHPLP
ncbi:MAG: hypothetical protein ACI4V2_02120 [Alloprevotella sp.]